MSYEDDFLGYKASAEHCERNFEEEWRQSPYLGRARSTWPTAFTRSRSTSSLGASMSPEPKWAKKAAWSHRWWLWGVEVVEVEMPPTTETHHWDGPTSSDRFESWWMRFEASKEGIANGTDVAGIDSRWMTIAERLRALCATQERVGRSISHVDQFMKRAHELRDAARRGYDDGL